MDDAIRIGKYLTEYTGTMSFIMGGVKTAGSISVKVNSNREGNGNMYDNWIDYMTEWTDDKWHHVAVTWKKSSG